MPIRLNEWSDSDRGWLNARTRDIIVDVKDIGHDAAWPTPGQALLCTKDIYIYVLARLKACARTLPTLLVHGETCAISI